MNSINHWLDQLSPGQFAILATVLAGVTVIAAGSATTSLLNRHGWRAVPAIVVVMLAALCGIVVLLGRLS